MLRLFKTLLLAGGALGLLGLLVLTMALLYFSVDLPNVESAQNLELHQPLRVYATGGELVGEFGAERREPLAWKDVPEVLINAFLAAEDDRFFSHPGVDYQGLLRAAWVLVTTGEKAQGGSTITMQLARNLFLSNEKSYARKIREILLAFKLEQRFEKSEIMRLYLNKIFLGQRAYGVAAAARIYYGKNVDELALDEAAMIAGLPKAPSAYNPVANPTRARQRRNYVLRRMRELEMIRPAEEKQAREVPVVAALAPAAVMLDARYLAEMVRAQMHQRYGDDIYTAGVEVMTTIDATLQRAALRAVQQGVLDYDARHKWRGSQGRIDPAAVKALLTLDDTELRVATIAAWLNDLAATERGPLQPAIVLPAEDEAPLQLMLADARVVAIERKTIAWAEAKTLAVGEVVYLRGGDEAALRVAQIPRAQAALIALDPRDGAIKAVMGGFDFFSSKFNRATQARRQPGSSFKPFLYSAALEAGLTPAVIMNDAPVVFNDPALGGAWRPENYDGRFRGPTRLRQALVRSSNLVSIRVLEAVGISAFREHVGRFGLDARHLPSDLSIALGSGTFSPLEIAAAYTLFANGGYKVEPWYIDTVITNDGELVTKARPKRVCPECVAPQPTPAPEPAIQADAPDGPGDGALAKLESEDESAPSQPGDSASEATELAVVVEPTEPAEPASEPIDPAPQTLNAANAYIVADMLRDVIQHGTGRRARALGRRELAGKTGTTNEQRDAWFAGFHPHLVAVAWIGFDDLTPLGRGETGGKAALPIWMAFMQEALKILPEERPVPPAGVVTARIDPDTGQLSSQGQFELFLAEHLPTSAAAAELGPRNPSQNAAPDPVGQRASETVLEELF